MGILPDDYWSTCDLDALYAMRQRGDNLEQVDAELARRMGFDSAADCATWRQRASGTLKAQA